MPTKSEWYDWLVSPHISPEAVSENGKAMCLMTEFP